MGSKGSNHRFIPVFNGDMQDWNFQSERERERGRKGVCSHMKFAIIIVTNDNNKMHRKPDKLDATWLVTRTNCLQSGEMTS